MGVMRGSARAWETRTTIISSQSNSFRLDICSAFVRLHLIFMQQKNRFRVFDIEKYRLGGVEMGLRRDRR